MPGAASDKRKYLQSANKHIHSTDVNYGSLFMGVILTTDGAQLLKNFDGARKGDNSPHTNDAVACGTLPLKQGNCL